MAEDSMNKLEMLAKAKDMLLKEWDISFAINGETLINILRFCMELSTEVPIKFYKDRIFIHLKSPDNVQYAEIEINANDVLDYDAGIDGDPDRKGADSIVKGGTFGDYKPVLIDIKGTIDEIESFAQKDDVVIIRIDTFYRRKIEFHCSDNVVIWAQLVDPSIVMKSIEKLPDIIRNVRNNPDIKKASVIIEPATFARICAIGGKEKKRDVDKRIYIELDKNSGLRISSGDRLKGRIFELRPIDVSMEDRMGESEYSDFGDSYAEGMYDGNVSILDASNEKSVMESPVDVHEEGEIDSMGGMDDFSFAPSQFASSGTTTENDNVDDRERNERRRSDLRSQTDQLLGMDIDDNQHVYLEKEFLAPFSKLKGLSPIVIEVRTNKPIVLEQRPYNGIRAMLTVAPRIEDDEE